MMGQYTSGTNQCDPQRWILGLDGGGTKTVAWLAQGDGATSYTTLGAGASGPSNPQAVGEETAQRNILRAIQAAFAAAQLQRVPVAAACLALAGVGREPIRQRILDWSQHMSLARQIRVVHDAQAVLCAGTSAGHGVALICGTGSFAYGESAAGEWARSGGWGYLFGDEGSGFHLGCAALRAVVREADHRGPATILTPLVQQQLRVRQPSELIPAIYGAATMREDVAGLAASVFQAAEQADVVARGICDEAAQELCQLVESILGQLQFSADCYELALAGGVLANQPAFCGKIVTSLQQRGSVPLSHCVVQEPVAGAVRLAGQMLE